MSATIEAPREKVEFEHLSRILGGVGMMLPLADSRAGRTARAVFESHISHHYDRPGCFAYVGWSAEPDPAIQNAVQSAFHRAAVATGVFLGALEPNEGFAMASWSEVPTLVPADYDRTFTAIKKTIAHARHILCFEQKRTAQELEFTHVAVGCGRIRGHAVFGKQPKHVILDGPEAIASLYGEIPNQCGAIAKGKHAAAKRLFPNQPSGLRFFTLYRQPWIYFHLNGDNKNVTSVWHGQGPVPHHLLTLESIKPQPLSADALQPYLVGLSLDFANSGHDYEVNAHRARTVVNRIFTDFEKLTVDEPRLFVSPRYGDGVSAVIVIDARSEAEVMMLPWMSMLHRFCRRAKVELGRCDELGLRIGIAVELDRYACSPRLAGVNHTASPAVEPLAQKVIRRAQAYQRMAKKCSPPIKTRRTVRCIQHDPNDENRVELVLFAR